MERVLLGGNHVDETSLSKHVQIEAFNYHINYNTISPTEMFKPEMILAIKNPLSTRKNLLH